MRTRFQWIVLVAVASCAAPAPPPSSAPAVVMVAPSGSGPVRSVEPETGLDPLALPEGSAITASLDPLRFSSWLSLVVRFLGAREQAEAERALGLPPGTLGSGDIADAVGIDRGRPLRLGLALTQEGRASIPTLRSIAKQVQDDNRPHPKQTSDVKQALRDHPGPYAHLRLVLPSSSSSRLKETFTSLLQSAQYDVADPQGLESVWTKRDNTVVLTPLGGHLVLDLFWASALKGVRLREAVLHTVRTTTSPTGPKAPLLEGQAVRVVYSPAALAEVGFVLGVQASQRSLEGLDEDTQERIGTEGLREALQNFTLAGTTQGVYFERVEVAADAASLFPSVSGRADFGPALAGALSGCGAAPSVEFPSVGVSMDASVQCLRGLRTPGATDTPGNGRSELNQLSRQAGWPGPFVALPFHITDLAQEMLRSLYGLDQAPFLRLDRYGVLMIPPNLREAHWGLLPASASLQHAQCALESQPTNCPVNRRLKLGGIVERSNWSVRLLQLSGRYVILLANERSVLESLAPKPTSGPVPPLHANVSSAGLTQALQFVGLPFTPVGYRAEVRIDQATSLSVSIVPVP